MIIDGNELIFEKKSANEAQWLPELDEKALASNAHYDESDIRSTHAILPEISELELVRHFTRLSKKNFSVDANFYPLGSCTMKYNPKVLDQIASMDGFANVHPYQDDSEIQGALEVLYDMGRLLSSIAGMKEFTLQPAAGAHGELCGLLIIGAYHRSKKKNKTKVLIPDSAHGTNPATAALCGYEVVTIKTDSKGHVDLDDLRAKTDDRVACLMLTNPNTLGLFEEQITQITKTVHQHGGLVYYDGANMNALLGLCRPGDMGFDVVHLNLHKTFAVPHGSGGPGSGPVGVKEELVPFLPKPRVLCDKGLYRWDDGSSASIGKLRSFYGNFGAIIRAYGYILALGEDGLRSVSENAIINANYLKEKLKQYFEVPFSGPCMHEFVASASKQKKQHGVRALDIAKRLLDYGIHAPTVYFPLIVEEALMIEPTETESKQTLDHFIETMIQIFNEVESAPAKVQQAPMMTSVLRMDEVTAARNPNLRYKQSL